MIGNCQGCQEELGMAEEYAEQGYHVATSLDREFRSKGHLVIMLVDDNGKIVVS